VDPAETDAFAAIAPFYDLDLEGYDGDVDWYRALARSIGGPVLELGCGTGRVANALAGDGIEVAGVDVSEAMLAMATEHALASTGGAAPSWVAGDMRSLELGRTFALVLVPLGGLQHLLELDELVAAMETIRRHLSPEGQAIVDVEAPLPEDLTPGPQPLIEHWTRDWRPRADGAPLRVTKLVSVEAFPAQSRRAVTWHFDVQGAEAPLRRTTVQFELRTFTPGELELAGRLAGLEVTGTWGDYDLSPFDDGAERLVMAFGRAEGAA
jgi:ubiquinone/menaquinone biosynthesis C-methylase UbiE